MPAKKRKKSAPYLDDHGRVEAVIYAELHGDEAAAKRYNVTVRTLRNWRERVRDPDDEITEVFRAFKAAIDPDFRPHNFAQWLRGQTQDAARLFLEKAQQLDPRNPEALRALNEHMQALLDHAAAIEYITRLFDTPEPHAQRSHTEDHKAGPVDAPAWGRGGAASPQAEA